MSDESFLDRIERLISENRSDDVVAAIMHSSEEDASFVSEFSFELVRIVGRHLSAVASSLDDGEEEARDSWINLSAVLEYLTKTSCKPKEALLGLLEGLESAKSCRFFLLVTPLLQSALLSLPSVPLAGRVAMLRWTLFEVSKFLAGPHIVELVDQQFSDLEDEERLLLRNSSELRQIDECVRAAIDLCEPFIVAFTVVQSKRRRKMELLRADEREEQQVLASFLLKLVECPLARCTFLSSACDDKNTELLDLAVARLYALCPNAFERVFDWFASGQLSLQNGSTASSREARISPIAIGAFLFASFALGGDTTLSANIPAVYSGVYLFERCLPYLNALLRCSNQETNALGVRLAEHLSLFRLNTNEVNASTFFGTTEWLSTAIGVKHLLVHLVHSMTLNRRRSVRALAVRVLDEGLLQRFDDDAKLATIRFFFASSNAVKVDANVVDEERPPQLLENVVGDAVRGYFIDFYRRSLVRSRKTEAQKDGIPRTFDLSLRQMLAMFVASALRDGETTDLLGNVEQLSATLNLLRFLALLSGDDCGGVDWRLVVDQFLKPLERGLELTRAHYKLEERQTKGNMQATVKKPVDGEESPDEQKLHALDGALSRLELLACVLFRTKELVEAKTVQSASTVAESSTST